jgi:beta-lactamase regulating signal transducer with metallopeptidase domain
LARRTPAGTRALIWRSATIAVPVVCVGNLLQLHSLTAAVPGALAAPLIALGQLQLAETDGAVVEGALRSARGAVSMTALVWALVTVWLGGAIGIACWFAAGWRSVRVVRAGARHVSDLRWMQSLEEARIVLGVRQPVALLAADVSVPITCGIVRPSIIVPAAALAWSAEERRAALLHEMGHVRGADLAFALLARATCVVLWFHPGVWWVAHRLRAECEHAADDRVLVAGVRASDYAELLVATAARVLGRGVAHGPALALSEGGGLRSRLTAIVDTTRDRRAPLGRTMAFAVAVTVVVAAPAATVRLAPTREVLTTLMRDARWESRAYAVIGLAQRADSVDVARAAAEGDPSPRVRAWAKLALSRNAVQLMAPLAEPTPRVRAPQPSRAGSPI